MKKVVGSAVAVLALASAVFFVPKVSASSGTMLPRDGTLSIPIVRKVNNIAGHATVTFTYKFEPKEGNPDGVGSLQASTGLIFDDNIDSGSHTLNARCTLQMSSMTFYKVGDYAFTLSEESTSDPLNFPVDTTNKYDIYYRVTNVLDENNEPTGELHAEILNQMYSYKDDAKIPLGAANFESGSNYTYISLVNKVNGSAADADKYFKYKVRFMGMPNGVTLDVIGQDSQVVYNGETITTTSSYTTGGEDLYVYLKHGQEAQIGTVLLADGTHVNEIPFRRDYEITRVGTDDGYVTKIDGELKTNAFKAASGIDGEQFEENNRTVITNSKDASVNTGVFSETWPYLLVAALSLSGVLIVRRFLGNVNA